jgi:hypothetical protein
MDAPERGDLMLKREKLPTLAIGTDPAGPGVLKLLDSFLLV